MLSHYCNEHAAIHSRTMYDLIIYKHCIVDDVHAYTIIPYPYIYIWIVLPLYLAFAVECRLTFVVQCKCLLCALQGIIIPLQLQIRQGKRGMRRSQSRVFIKSSVIALERRGHHLVMLLFFCIDSSPVQFNPIPTSS